MRMDLLVVGAGRAGLAAAAAASAHGLSVVVVDERRTPGGRTSGAPGTSAHDPDAAWLVPPLVPDAAGEADVARLLEAARGATLLGDALVWGVFPGWVAAVSRGERGTERVDADQVVLATGAHVARHPFPGHHLDGVVTPLGMVRAIDEGVLRPGERVAVLGDGDLADAVLARLAAEGVRDVTLLASRARTASVPVRVLGAAPRAEGDPRVRRVALTLADGTREALDADWVVVAGPRTPAAELASLAGVASRFAGYAAGFVPLCGPDGATAVPGLYLAGSVAGAEGPAASERSGALAGLAAAVRAGRAPAAQLHAALAERPAAPPPAPRPLPAWVRELDPASSAPVCSCTGATFAEAARSIRDGARSIDDVKRQAKAGMGPCQGRGCHRAVARLLEVVGGVDVATLQPMRARPPVRPLTARAMFEGEVPA